MHSRRTAAAAVLLLATYACSQRSNVGLPASEPAVSGASGQAIVSPIPHVVISVQENRTPDNLFQGVAGADIAKSGVDSRNQKIALVPQTFVENWDLGHNRVSFVADYNEGKMNGWDSRLPWSEHQRPYSYVPQKQAQPYLDM